MIDGRCKLYDLSVNLDILKMMEIPVSFFVSAISEKVSIKEGGCQLEEGGFS